jgi:hypothetical protein
MSRLIIEDIPLSSFAGPFQRRCRAVLGKADSPTYYGQCELKAAHDEQHTLERGMEVICWGVYLGNGKIVKG